MTRSLFARIVQTSFAPRSLRLFHHCTPWNKRPTAAPDPLCFRALNITEIRRACSQNSSYCCQNRQQAIGVVTPEHWSTHYAVMSEIGARMNKVG
jgi:hypothetical protein